MKIGFFGSPDFALPSLDRLYKSSHDVSLVVTKPDMPKGRKKILQPTIIKKRALELNIPVLTPSSLTLNFIKELEQYDLDCIVVVAYGKIIGPTMLKKYKDRVINLHPSMLPHLRGAAPIHNAILEGLEETGITIMHLCEELDAGDIIKQIPFKIEPETYVETLHDELAVEGAKLLEEVLNDIESGQNSRIAQDNSKATFCKPIVKSEGKINWKLDAFEIDRHVRAYHVWPGSFTFFEEKLLKIHRVKIVDKTFDKPGRIVEISEDGLLVSTGDKSILITELQPATRKIMNVSTFLRGNKMVLGTQFS